MVGEVENKVEELENDYEQMYKDAIAKVKELTEKLVVVEKERDGYKRAYESAQIQCDNAIGLYSTTIDYVITKTTLKR